MMPDAYVLDLPRSLRRVGQLATGIDRVERAYLREMLTLPLPVFGLVRTPLGYLLLDRKGMEAAQRLLEAGGDLPKASILSRLSRGRREEVARAETALRAQAIGRAVRLGLAGLLKRHLKGGFVYFNVGHSNLDRHVVRSLRRAGGLCHVLIHDTIPLDHPGFQKPGQPERFARKLAAVRDGAHQVICPSITAADGVGAILGAGMPITVAPIGVDVVRADPALLTGSEAPRAPYFVTVGTIEPRKNHAFLLDLWDQMGEAAPRLLICGARGWNNQAVFERLDRMPPDGPIVEHNALPDAALAALVEGAAGALFPTLAEGFGIPPVEARMLGTRVLCNDLPVLQENLAGKATFIPVSEPHLWLDSIHKWGRSDAVRGVSTGFEGPGWQDHFKTVLSLA